MLAPNDIRISTSLCKREEENIATESVPKCRLNSMSETHNEKRKLFFAFYVGFRRRRVSKTKQKKGEIHKNLLLLAYFVYIESTLRSPNRSN